MMRPEPPPPSFASLGFRGAKVLGRIMRDNGGRWLFLGLELATKLGDALPNRQDKPVKAALKTVGAVGIVRTVLFPNTTDKIEEFAARNGLEKQRSAPFVRLFWSTELHNAFTLTHVPIDDWRAIVDARGPLGRIVFVKNSYSGEPNDTFYVPRDLDMPRMLEGLWEQYSGRVHVSITPGKYGESLSEFARAENLDDQAIFGATAQLLEKTIARHRRCTAQGVGRSYMIFGPPGTGKSVFATRLASAVGDRVLTLNAQSLAHATMKEILFLFENLAPQVLIIDDVDKVAVGNALPTLLGVLKRMKLAKATVILTSNSIEGFDKGIARPERVDTWLEFKLPDMAERCEVITRYAQALDAPLMPYETDTMACEAEGLSHDYLRELVVEYRQCGSFEETMALLATQKRILVKVEKKDGAAKPDAPKTVSP